MLIVTATELPRLIGCNGSRNMSPSFPATATDQTEREKGNAAHWLAKNLFDGGSVAVNDPAYNGVFITSEMIDHVNDYLSSLGWSGRMEVETSHGTEAYQVNGRADHIGYCTISDTLYVDEFKYGRRIVSPVMNWTMISHAVGYCTINQIMPRNIVFTVHQPRAHHRDGTHRNWVVGSYAQLMSYALYMHNVLSAPTDTLQTGDHCYKCPANATCPAAIAANYNGIDATTAQYDDTITDNQLAYELDLRQRALDRIQQQYNALAEMAKYRVTHGAVVPNYAVEHQQGNRRFKAHITPAIMQALTGVDCSEPAKLCTPAAAERRGISKEIIKSLSERPTTGSKLVRVDAGDKAKKIFG